VLDVGAGTGKLARALVATGARVLAVEPVAAMRAVLEQVAPAATVLAAAAEALPVPGAAVDAVTAASAFHWFDAPAALREFHRVLRPRGRLALVWNRKRREEPLHQAITEVIDPYRGNAPDAYARTWRDALDTSPLFAPAGELMMPFEQRLNPPGLVDRVASISFVAAQPDAERRDILARVRRIAEAGPSPLVLGYVVEAYTFERVDTDRDHATLA
jgi:SAM-dependent methyltransferase